MRTSIPECRRSQRIRRRRCWSGAERALRGEDAAHGRACVTRVGRPVDACIPAIRSASGANARTKIVGATPALLLDPGSLCDDDRCFVGAGNDVNGFRRDAECPTGAAPYSTNDTNNSADQIRPNYQTKIVMHRAQHIPYEQLDEHRRALVHGHVERLEVEFEEDARSSILVRKRAGVVGDTVLVCLNHS